MKRSSATIDKVPQINRVSQLDGLRGVAIILVILNHMRLTPFFSLLPKELNLFFSSFTLSGKVAVSLLFLLSGYLMSTIYPVVNSKLAFYQKRYTRIFPAFVTMCFALAIIRFFWVGMSWISITLLLIAIFFISGQIWQFIQKSESREKLGKKIFYCFLVVQILTVLAYIFVLPKVPPAVFYQIWSPWSRQLIFLLMNATMALPFGNYVPQFDGAFWSVLTEVGLYLLYPIFFLPLINTVKNRRSPLVVLGAFLLSFPFFYGMSLLSNSILGLGMTNAHLAIYFVFGVAIGTFITDGGLQKIHDNTRKIPGAALFLLCAFLIIGTPIIESRVYFGFQIDSLIWAIPISLLMLITLSGENAWTKFLRMPWLVKIGQLSFSLYLTHTIAIEMFVKNGEPKTVLEMLLCGVPAIATMGALSWLMNHFLEQPYLTNKIQKKQLLASKKSNKVVKNANNFNAILSQTSKKSYRKTAVGAVLILLFLVWYGFRIPVQLTADVVNHRVTTLPPVSVISGEPIQLPFTAAQDNLGMFLFEIRPLSVAELKAKQVNIGSESVESLVISLFDEQKNLISSNTFKLSEISDSRFFSMGVPIQADSQGKKYFIELRLSSSHTTQKVGLVNSSQTFRTVYFISKSTLIKNPKSTASLLFNKLTQPFSEPKAQAILLLCLPILFILL